MKKISVYLLAATAACLVLAVLVFGYRIPRGINVSVINSSGQTLNDVVVSYTGGRHRVGGLPIGTRKRFDIKPTGESHLELTIVPQAGAARHRSVDIYFEPDYRGSIELTISNDFTVLAAHDAQVY